PTFEGMNKKILTVVSVFFSLALLVLILFQVYWIKYDFEVREDLFRERVDEALNRTASKLERLDRRSDYTKITKTVDGVFSPPVTSQGPVPLGMYRSEFSVDRNGRQTSRYTQ